MAPRSMLDKENDCFVIKKNNKILRESLDILNISRKNPTNVSSGECQNTNIVVVVSGGFDPVHIGHIKMFQQAKMLGDKLVVILNNDNWLRTKKGYVFMNEHDRATLLKSIRYIDDVIITTHAPHAQDMSVCTELKLVRPHIFANGGDRNIGNIPEVYLCNDLGIKMVWNVGGGKLASSSELVKQAKNAAPV